MGYFPEVLVVMNDDREMYCGTIGLQMQALLKGDLMVSSLEFQDKDIPHLNRMSAMALHTARESFLHAIAGLPATISMELHICALPNLANQANSRMEITLFLRGEANTEEQIKESLLAQFLSIKPLIATHIPEADFRAITDLGELRTRLEGEPFHKAVEINRRREDVVLTSLVRNLAIGFVAKPWEVGDQGIKNVVSNVNPFVPSSEDWGKLAGMMLAQIDRVKIIVRLRAIAADEAALQRLNETVGTCDRFLATVMPEQSSLKLQAQMIRKQAMRQLANLPEAAFNLGVFLLTDTDHRFLGQVLGKAITGLSSRFAEDNGWQGGFAISEVSVSKSLAVDYYPDSEPFTAVEASCAFRLPSPPFEEIPGLPIRRFRTSLALLPGSRKSGGITLGVNEHQGSEQPIAVSMEDRFRHCFIIGQTGTGKSTLMESMILQDIHAGRGVAVIDPHGEMVELILGRIPRERVEDVIFFDPLDTERPLGFNLLEWKTCEERDLIIDELYQALDRIYDMSRTGGPIFERHYRGMMRLLLGDKPRENYIPTILEFPMCYLDRKFREYLTANMQDPGQLSDFVKETEDAMGDCSLASITPYITAKFSRFSQDTILRRIFGQEKTSIDFDEVLAQGRIVLVSLGKGRFGNVTSALLANMLVSRFKLAAMKRALLKPSKRRPFFLYIDEAHNLPAENFMELLSEARKYRLGLVLATQYAAQLTHSCQGSQDNLLSAILGNVGQTVIFRVGQEDAIRMAPALTPYFSSNDIIGLPNWHGYARMQLNNETVAPFSFKTLRSDLTYHAGVAEGIKNFSRLKYGRPAATIDESISRRRKVWR